MNAPWGALLEAELAGADVVRAHVVSHGPVEVPASWARGREAPTMVFATRAEASAAVATAWSADRRFVVREVPALRLDTTIGRLLLVDVWGDSGFRPLSTRAGAGPLRLDSPIVGILECVDAMRAAARADARIAVVPIGWESTTCITRHEALTAWTTVARDGGPEGGDRGWDWVPEPEGGIGDGPWAALRAFGHVNGREEILRSARLVVRAERPPRDLPPGSGLGAIEDYLRSMAGETD